jgi:hypothetical protein
MNNEKFTRMADFLSIAVEQLEAENYDVAEDFVQDVYGMVQEELDEQQ